MVFYFRILWQSTANIISVGQWGNSYSFTEGLVVKCFRCVTRLSYRSLAHLLLIVYTFGRKGTRSDKLKAQESGEALIVELICRKARLVPRNWAYHGALKCRRSFVANMRCHGMFFCASTRMKSLCFLVRLNRRIPAM